VVERFERKKIQYENLDKLRFSGVAIRETIIPDSISVIACVQIDAYIYWNSYWLWRFV